MTDLSKDEKIAAELIRMRDEMAAIQKEADAKIATIKQRYAKGESYFLERLNALGSGASLKLSTGTVYTTERLQASIGDKGAFANFIRETGEVELLQQRVSTTVLKDFMEQNAGAVPPGITASVERTLTIRRPSAK